MYDESDWIRINETPATECWTGIDELLEGIESQFRVRAVNDVRDGPPSSIVIVPGIPLPLPLPPGIALFFIILCVVGTQPLQCVALLVVIKWRIEVLK